ncbi:MAG TPA: hypothetical protein VKA19_12565 [Alphaproteobacteria bacterium]|nr:hypothetical protein [Alphaproteobacteria bacterium]
MKIFSKDKSELMDVSALERDGNALVIKGKVFGTMPMQARLTPEEARKGLKLLSVNLFFFLITFPFRRSK